MKNLLTHKGKSPQRILAFILSFTLLLGSLIVGFVASNENSSPLGSSDAMIFKENSLGDSKLEENEFPLGFSEEKSPILGLSLLRSPRSSVSVQNLQQLKSAVTSGNASTIVLTNDIHITETIDVTRNIQIDGGGYTLSIDGANGTPRTPQEGFSVVGNNLTVTIENANLIVGSYYGLVHDYHNKNGVGTTVIYDNVSFKGVQMFYLVYGGNGVLLDSDITLAPITSEPLITSSDPCEELGELSSLTLGGTVSIYRTADTVSNKGLVSFRNSLSAATRDFTVRPDSDVLIYNNPEAVSPGKMFVNFNQSSTMNFTVESNSRVRIDSMGGWMNANLTISSFSIAQSAQVYLKSSQTDPSHYAPLRITAPNTRGMVIEQDTIFALEATSLPSTVALGHFNTIPSITMPEFLFIQGPNGSPTKTANISAQSINVRLADSIYQQVTGGPSFSDGSSGVVSNMNGVQIFENDIDHKYNYFSYPNGHSLTMGNAQLQIMGPIIPTSKEIYFKIESPNPFYNYTVRQIVFRYKTAETSGYHAVFQGYQENDNELRMTLNNPENGYYIFPESTTYAFSERQVNIDWMDTKKLPFWAHLSKDSVGALKATFEKKYIPNERNVDHLGLEEYDYYIKYWHTDADESTAVIKGPYSSGSPLTIQGDDGFRRGTTYYAQELILENNSYSVLDGPYRLDSIKTYRVSLDGEEISNYSEGVYLPTLKLWAFAIIHNDANQLLVMNSKAVPYTVSLTGKEIMSQGDPVVPASDVSYSISIFEDSLDQKVYSGDLLPSASTNTPVKEFFIGHEYIISQAQNDDYTLESMQFVDTSGNPLSVTQPQRIDEHSFRFTFTKEHADGILEITNKQKEKIGTGELSLTANNVWNPHGIPVITLKLTNEKNPASIYYATLSLTGGTNTVSQLNTPAATATGALSITLPEGGYQVTTLPSSRYSFVSGNSRLDITGGATSNFTATFQCKNYHFLSDTSSLSCALIIEE